MLTERQAKFIEAEARDQGVWQVADAVGPLRPGKGGADDAPPEGHWGVELRLHYGAQYWVRSLHQWLKLYDKVEELKAVVAEATGLGCRVASSFPTRVGKDSMYIELMPPHGHATTDFVVRVGARKTWEQYKSKWFDYVEGTVAEDIKELESAPPADQ
jgi:hypothetical protein